MCVCDEGSGVGEGTKLTVQCVCVQHGGSGVGEGTKLTVQCVCVCVCSMGEVVLARALN